MNFQIENSISNDMMKIDNHLPKIGKEQITKKIINGLQDTPKNISSMFFYDAKGSKLFEKITELPEYYPTRIEKSLLQQVSAKLGRTLKNKNIVELGSGDSSKITILLNGIPKEDIKSVHYTAVDVSQPAIEESANNLRTLFSDLSIHGIVADFSHQLHLIPKNDSHIFCFFGSTLGNFTNQEANTFFQEVAKNMHNGDHFLLGIDMIKDIDTLEKAYNDSQKITEQFNKNILNVINNIIKSDFNINDFNHLAFYNKEKARIEMHLVAQKDININIPQLAQPLYIKNGEKIHTENSHKFTIEKITKMAELARLNISEIISDDDNLFSIVTLTKQ